MVFALVSIIKFQNIVNTILRMSAPHQYIPIILYVFSYETTDLTTDDNKFQIRLHLDQAPGQVILR